jgi:hypothetical protein
MLLWTAACSSPEGHPALADDMPEDAGTPAKKDAGAPEAGADAGDATPAVDRAVFDAAKPKDATPDGEAGFVDAPVDAPPDVVDECEAGLAVEIAPPPDAAAALCGISASWGAGVVVAVSTAADDTFGAITPDGLTIAWMAPESSQPTLHYADRNATTDPFGTTHLIAPGYYAPGRAALSPDGLRLIVVQSGGKAFGEYTRVDRTDTFSTVASGAAFDALNALGLSFTANESFGDPIVSNDDRTFYYSRYGGGEVETMFASVRPDEIGWPVGTSLQGAMLDAKCGKRRRPTGISSDGLTLFYWDDLSGSERAAYRPSVGAAFTGAIDLGQLAEAQPTAACDALFYSGKGSSGVDIFRAPRN